jgi:hypothetical protein
MTGGYNRSPYRNNGTMNTQFIRVEGFNIPPLWGG